MVGKLQAISRSLEVKGVPVVFRMLIPKLIPKLNKVVHNLNFFWTKKDLEMDQIKIEFQVWSFV